MNLRVLITDGDQKHTLGIVRSLGKVGITVGVLTSKKKSLSNYSKYCESEYVIDAKCPKKYLDQLINIYKSNNYNVLLPVGSNANLFCVKYREILIDNGIKFSIPSTSSFNEAFSKEFTANKANSLGILTPKTWYFNSIAELGSFNYNFSNKLVIKARLEMGQNVVRYVSSKSELLKEFKSLCKIYNWTNSSEFPLVQEYIDGPGRGFFALYKDGQCLSTFQHIRLREYPISGGMSVCAKYDFKDEVNDKGIQLLDSLNWNGIAMVEFKENKDGLLYLLEINPKFWGSIELAIFCGINFPLEYVLLSLGREIEIKQNEIVPKTFHWPLHGDVQTAFASIKRLRSFLSDLFNQKVGSNVDLKDDIKGTIGIILNLSEKLLKLR